MKVAHLAFAILATIALGGCGERDKFELATIRWSSAAATLRVAAEMRILAVDVTLSQLSRPTDEEISRAWELVEKDRPYEELLRYLSSVRQTLGEAGNPHDPILADNFDKMKRATNYLELAVLRQRDRTNPRVIKASIITCTDAAGELIDVIDSRRQKK